MSALDVDLIKTDFPIFKREVNGKRLVYLDSASSSQKPVAVLEAMDQCYREYYANVHRGVYAISEETTAAYEGARGKIARFIHARSEREIIFTRNATEAINLVAYSWARHNLKKGDAIVLSDMEHHANIVPWQILASEMEIELRWIPLRDDYRLNLHSLPELLDGAKLLAVSALSNVLGTANDVRPLADAAHAAGALILLDACQAVPHMTVDVQAWDADFIAFSSHKMCGPSGIGALWARESLLDAMPPFMGGGDMIRDVRKDGFTPNELPWKFEAGTPAIAEAIGFGAAVDYLSAIGVDAIHRHETELTKYALKTLTDAFGPVLKVYGPSTMDLRGSAISFSLSDIHPHDISQVLDEDGICVRAGHHCAKPLMKLLDVAATARASFYLYNDRDDVDALVESLIRARAFFKV